MNAAPPETPEQSPPPPPPEELKPWYYQVWFLYPSIMFWPLWSLLILRSPWHNGLISGAVAWAMLFVGSYAVYAWGLGGRAGLDGLLAGNITPAALLTGQIILPGLLLIVVTQTHWQRNRRRIMAAARDGAGRAAATPAKPAATASSRRRHRSRKRRGKGR